MFKFPWSDSTNIINVCQNGLVFELDKKAS